MVEPGLAAEDCDVRCRNSATHDGTAFTGISEANVLRCAFREHFDGGQRLAFEELEERAAAGGDVADSSATPYFAIAASVSPPPAIENAGDCGDRVGDRLACLPQRVELEHADRAVPDDGAGAARSAVRSIATVCGPMSRIMSSSATSSTALIAGARVGRELLRAHDVDRDRHLARGTRRGSRVPRAPGRPRPATCRCAGLRRA